MRGRFFIWLVAALGLMTATAHADVLYSCTQSTTYQPALSDTRHPAGFSHLPPEQKAAYFPQWLAYYCSGDYMRDITNKVDEARSILAKRAVQPGEKLAIVLDIDETSINNEASILGGDLRDDPNVTAETPCGNLKKGCGYTYWERQGRSAAIKPTLQLFREARARGIAVFFITGRSEETPARHKKWGAMRIATARNLSAIGYGDYACLFLKPVPGRREQVSKPDCAAIASGLASEYPDTFASTAPYKQDARRAIIAQGYRIVLNMGDQHSDLGVTPGVDDGTAEARVLLPNPFY